MTLIAGGANDKVSARDRKNRQSVVQIANGWDTIIHSVADIGGASSIGLTGSDNVGASITDPMVQIGSTEAAGEETRVLWRTNGNGTIALFMMAVDPSSVDGSIVIEVFGRALADIEVGQGSQSQGSGDIQRFNRLPLRDESATQMTIPVASDDTTNSQGAPATEILKYTGINSSTLAVDLLGCDELVVGVVTPFAPVAGDSDLARLLVKLI